MSSTDVPDFVVLFVAFLFFRLFVFQLGLISLFYFLPLCFLPEDFFLCLERMFLAGIVNTIR